jgi:hypothetical protein
MGQYFSLCDVHYFQASRAVMDIHYDTSRISYTVMICGYNTFIRFSALPLDRLKQRPTEISLVHVDLTIM